MSLDQIREHLAKSNFHQIALTVKQEKGTHYLYMIRYDIESGLAKVVSKTPVNESLLTSLHFLDEANNYLLQGLTRTKYLDKLFENEKDIL